MSLETFAGRTTLASRMARTRWGVLAAWLAVAGLSVGFWIKAAQFVTVL